MDAGIGEFLRTRRARLNPDAVGVPRSLTRRRVDGLRREEVALLAGVSPDYYVRLEQGRTNGVSRQVLDAVARALQLSAAETEHLQNLARRPPPPITDAAVDADADADMNLRRLVDAWQDVPALMLDQKLDILYWNVAAEAVFAVRDMGDMGDMDDMGGLGDARNAARHLFRDPDAALLYDNWDTVAAATSP